MAQFDGTIAEFHRHLGPRIRNAVNLFARVGRLACGGVCQECGRSEQVLDSAHVTGRGRRKIIDEVLAAHTVAGHVRCDLAAVERQVIAAHGGAETSFRYLCKPCHRRYDAVPTRGEHKPPAGNLGEGPVIQLSPAGDDAFKARLIAVKRAVVRLEMRDGRERSFVWHAYRFRQSSNLRGNLFSGYLRDWRERGIVRASVSVEG